MNSSGETIAVAIFLVAIIVVLVAVVTGLVREHCAPSAAGPVTRGSGADCADPDGITHFVTAGFTRCGCDRCCRERRAGGPLTPYPSHAFGADASQARPQTAVVRIGGEGARATGQRLRNPAKFEADLLAQDIPVRVVAISE